MRHARYLAPMTFLLVAAACGGTGGTTIGDGGVGEGGCLEGTPTQGAACSQGQVLCNPGDLCCGGKWSCDATTNTWKLLQGGCPCAGGDAGHDAGHADASKEGAADAPADGNSGDASSGDGASCPATCETASDCQTCPMKPFGGWSCGPMGTCQFMG